MDSLPLVVTLEGGLARCDLERERQLLRIAGWFGATQREPDPDTLPLEPHAVNLIHAEIEHRPVLVVGSLSLAAMQSLCARIHPGLMAISAAQIDAPASLPDRFALYGKGYPALALAAVDTLTPVPAPRAVPLQALRPHHWVKNLLVFVPLLAAQRWDATALWMQSVLAFAAFCLVSSAIYLTNDLFDIPDDRRHPVKRQRPLASGDMLPTQALALLAVAAALGFGLAIWVGILSVLVLYAVVALAYSLKLKTWQGVDLAVLVGLYALRLLAGGVATGIAVSGWLLAYAGMIFASLAMAKRAAELAGARTSALPLPQRRGYRLKDQSRLTMLGGLAALGSVAVLLLYLNSPQARALYDRPVWLMVAGAVVLLWLLRLWRLIGQSRMTGDPVVFALRDPISLLSGIGVIGLLLLAAG